MPRQYVDCREVPSETGCTITIAADDRDEVLAAAVQHAVAVHGHEDSPELREMVASGIREGTPPG